MNEHQIGKGSLLDGISVPVFAPRPTLRQRWNSAVDARVAAARAWANAVPGRPQRLQNAAAVALAALVVAAGTATWLVVRPRSVPNYAKDPFTDVLDYTLLSDEFNSLPIEKRLELIRDLVKRFKSMDGSESLLVAEFAAGIAGNARKQLEKNASKLVLDVLDRGAIAYQKAPAEEREKAIEKTFVDLYRTMDAIDGRDSEKSDKDILDEGKRESQRREEWIKKQDSDRLGRNTGRMMLSLHETVGKESTAQQRGRMGLMMRDMTRHLRGEPLDKK